MSVILALARQNGWDNPPRRFEAEEGFPSAGKKILDTKRPAFKAVTSVKNRTLNWQRW